MPNFDVSILISGEFQVTETFDAADHDAAAAAVRARVVDGVFRYAQPSGRDDGTTIVQYYPADNLILRVVESPPPEARDTDAADGDIGDASGVDPATG